MATSSQQNEKPQEKETLEDLLKKAEQEPKDPDDEEYIQSFLIEISEDEPVGPDPEKKVDPESKDSDTFYDTFSNTDFKIKEAKKSEEWSEVKKLAEQALMKERKDLLLVIWLIEALIKKESFHGAYLGLYIFSELLIKYWEGFYPKDEKEKKLTLERQLEFINEKLINIIKFCPIVDGKYTFFNYDDTKKIEYESKDKIDEGKIAPEKFDEAIEKTSLEFYEKIKSNLILCLLQINKIDTKVNEIFVNNPPGFSKINKELLEDCIEVINDFIKRKVKKVKSEIKSDNQSFEIKPENQSDSNKITVTENQNYSNIEPMLDPYEFEQQLWNNIKTDAIAKLNKNGIHFILKELLKRAEYSPSLRIKNQFYLLMAQLCLKEKRKDLAQPIVFQLNEILENSKTNISEWEAQTWIANVYDTFYQCIDDKEELKNELRIKICKTDVTKLIST